MGNLQVRFLEGWAPAMAPGYSTLGIISGCPSSESNPQFSAQVGTPTLTDTAARSCGPRARVAPIAISSFSSGLVPCARPGLQLFQPRSPSGPIPTSGTTDLCRTDGWPFLPRGGIPLFGKYDELPRECFESRG